MAANITVPGGSYVDLTELIQGHMNRTISSGRSTVFLEDAGWLTTRSLREEAERLTDLSNKAEIIQALRDPGSRILNLLNARARQLAWQKRELELLEELDPLDYEQNPLEGAF